MERGGIISKNPLSSLISLSISLNLFSSRVYTGPHGPFLSRVWVLDSKVVRAERVEETRGR
jgi:hypothetical protein